MKMGFSDLFGEPDETGSIYLSEKLYEFKDFELTIDAPLKIVSIDRCVFNVDRIICSCPNVYFNGIDFTGSIVFRAAHGFMISDCTFAEGNLGSGGSIVLTRTKGAVINKCKFTKTQTTALFLEYESEMQLTDCSFDDLESDALHLSAYSEIIVEFCSFLNIKGSAIYLVSDAYAMVSNSTISNISSVGVSVNHSRADLLKCSISYISVNGISVSGSNSMSIENCDIHHIDSSSISLNGSVAVINSNKIQEIDGNAVIMQDSSFASITNNHISSVSYPAIAVLSMSSSKIEGNFIQKGKKAGICARFAKSAKIIRNELIDIQDVGVSVSDSTDVTIEGNSFHGCIIAGIESFNDSHVISEFNYFSNCGKSPFLCYAGGGMQSSNNDIEGVYESMVRFSTNGKGKFSNNKALECKAQYSGETSQIFLFEKNDPFKSVSNDKTLSDSSIMIVEKSPDTNHELCIKCKQNPRSGFFSPCGHRIYCKECAEKAMNNNEDCELCRFPISNIVNEYEASQDDTCTLCTEKKTKCVIIPCGHTGVCYDCAYDWIKTHGTCPVCRVSKASPKIIHDTY